MLTSQGHTHGVGPPAGSISQGVAISNAVNKEFRRSRKRSLFSMSWNHHALELGVHLSLQTQKVFPDRSVDFFPE